MQEFKRIFTNRNLISGLIIILIANAVLFYNQQIENNYSLDLSVANEVVWSEDGEVTVGTDVNAKECYQEYLTLLNLYKDKNTNNTYKELTLKLSEIKGIEKVAASALLKQLEHINSYDDYLKSIQNNKDSLLGFSIFNSSDSFSSRNVIKTAKDFQNLSDITLNLDNDSTINSFIKWKLTDYLAVLALVLICISFLSERKKGLWSVVYSSPNGRTNLYVKRISILFFASLLAMIFLYGSNLLIGSFIYDGIGNLNRPIQSISSFGSFRLQFTVGEVLIQYLIIKVITLFIVSLFLNLLLSAVENVKHSIVGIVVFMGLEYILFTYLPVQSAFNLFKYFNIFTYISLSELYTNYLNINVFGYPFFIRTISFGAMIPLCIILILLYILVGCKKKPMSTHDYFGKVIYSINRFTDKILKSLHLFGAEFYKIFFIQKGLIILALLVLCVTKIDFVANILPNSGAEAAADKIVAMLEGEVNEDTIQKMQNIQNNIDNAIKKYESAEEKYNNREIEYEDFYIYEQEYDNAKLKSNALQIVKERVEKLEKVNEKTGVVTWLLNETIYERVYGNNTQNTQQKTAIIAVLTLSLLIAGVFSYENQSATNLLLSACANGRKKLLYRKYRINFLSSLIVWGIVYGTEFYCFMIECKPKTLSAPIQSLSMFEKCPIHCNILMFLILLYLFRFIMLYCVGYIVLFISSKSKRVSIAYIASVGITVIPSAVYYFIGITPLKIISVTVPVSATNLLLSTQGTIHTILTAGLIMVIISLCCCYLIKKQYKANSFNFVKTLDAE